ncbi:hypothetical protein WJX72_001036 [[Myrmecia] bisecta]|uniref:Uncharacterized protein n=1 Tax=[Myrmecia] bisecta TaxID=41462 RepID=A0AAW1R4P9_9CHLO
MEQCKLEEFLRRKATGQLKIHAYQQRVSVAQQPAQLDSLAAEGAVRFGGVVQLAHAGSFAVLACDVSNKDQCSGDFTCSVSAVPRSGLCDPVARNTFTLAKYQPRRTELEQEPEHEDESVVHYGQKVMLLANPKALEGTALPPDASIMLYSRPVSTTQYAKLSRHQIVGLTSRTSYDAAWTVLTPDPAQRVISEGLPVLAGVPVLLQHCATNQDLCLEGVTFRNDLGEEHEVSGHTAHSNSKRDVCVHANAGKVRGQLEKMEQPANHWLFIGAFAHHDGEDEPQA